VDAARTKRRRVRMPAREDAEPDHQDEPSRHLHEANRDPSVRVIRGPISTSPKWRGRQARNSTPRNALVGWAWHLGLARVGTESSRPRRPERIRGLTRSLERRAKRRNAS
jgi:hypothetical protein